MNIAMSQDVMVIPLASRVGEQALMLRKQYWVDEYHWKKGDGTSYESDEFDSFSGHFGYIVDDHLVGYCRFIPNHSGSLPLVSVFPEVQARIEELGSACGEYSRLIIADDYRGKELSMLFFRAVFGWAYPRGYVWWFFEVEQWMIDLFRSLHFQVEVLSEGVFYRGVNGHPDQVTFSVLLDIESSIGVLSEEDPNLLSFFTSALHSRPA